MASHSENSPRKANSRPKRVGLMSPLSKVNRFVAGNDHKASPLHTAGNSPLAPVQPSVSPRTLSKHGWAEPSPLAAEASVPVASPTSHHSPRRRERPLTVQLSADAATAWTRNAKKKELITEVERLTALVAEYQSRVATYEREVNLGKESSDLLKKRLRRSEARAEALEKDLGERLWQSYAAMNSRGGY